MKEIHRSSSVSRGKFGTQPVQLLHPNPLLHWLPAGGSVTRCACRDRRGDRYLRHTPFSCRVRSVEIRLNPQLTNEHERLVVKYIARPSVLTRAEWLDALSAFDLLRTSIVIYEGQSMTFGA